MSVQPEEERYRVTRSWPPPGAKFTYDLTLEVGEQVIEMQMSAPTVPGEAIESESAMVLRIGGPSQADAVFRDELHAQVGMIVVQAGHVEAAMKRALLHLEGKSALLVEVDHTWSDLEKKLTRVATAKLPSDDARAFLDALDWSHTHHLKEIRDHVVHGYIWDYDVPVTLISRWQRKKSAIRVVATLDELRLGALRMHDFARMLETPLHGRWLEVALPEVADDHDVPPATRIRFATPGREDQHPT